MSWDAYKDSLDGYYCAEIQRRGEKGSSQLTHVGIFGLADGNPWMSTNKPWSITASAGDIKNIVSSFTQAQNPLGATGIKLGSMKFMYLRSDDTTVFGKKKGIGSICIYKSKTALLIVIASESAQAGDLNNATIKLGDYLTGNGM
ncbi:profilin-1A-like [Acanthaster planci]|uniref:Profilin n=1 Tax=Acanthaster planci TaxID=133434 RepID=A0A8B7Y6C1_ACAPL|nr:profilin-1A-like [Acanthaster planci]